jgi:hypothetical protein
MKVAFVVQRCGLEVNGRAEHHCLQIAQRTAAHWQTEFFLFNGWVRSLDLESRVAQGFRPVLAKYNWDPYVLQQLPHNHLEIAIGTSRSLGPGWHEREGRILKLCS